MAGESKRTTDHDEIRRWIEDRGGHPTVVKATEEDSGEGLLRVDFPGYRGKARLEEMSWDDFFRTFDDRQLEFLYQDQTKGGKTSRFSKFVNRGNESGGSSGSRKRGADSESKMTRSSGAAGERKSQSRSSTEKGDGDEKGSSGRGSKASEAKMTSERKSAARSSKGQGDDGKQSRAGSDKGASLDAKDEKTGERSKRSSSAKSKES